MITKLVEQFLPLIFLLGVVGLVALYAAAAKQKRQAQRDKQLREREANQHAQRLSAQNDATIEEVVTATPGRYRKQTFILTKAEMSFLSALERSLPPHTRVCIQIPLHLIISAVSDPETRQRDQNQIRQKFVDFVLCDQWTRPLLVIELDDSSHSATKRRDRDELVDAALASAGLPVLRVPARGSYDSARLREQIAGLVQGEQATASA